MPMGLLGVGEAKPTKKRKERDSKPPKGQYRDKVISVINPFMDEHLMEDINWGRITEEDRTKTAEAAAAAQNIHNAELAANQEQVKKWTKAEREGYSYKWTAEVVEEIMHNGMHNRFKKGNKDQHLARIHAAKDAAAKAEQQVAEEAGAATDAEGAAANTPPAATVAVQALMAALWGAEAAGLDTAEVEAMIKEKNMSSSSSNGGSTVHGSGSAPPAAAAAAAAAAGQGKQLLHVGTAPPAAAAAAAAAGQGKQSLQVGTAPPAAAAAAAAAGQGKQSLQVGSLVQVVLKVGKGRAAVAADAVVADLNDVATWFDKVKVNNDLILLKDVVVKDPYRAAAQSATFWQDATAKSIQKGKTSLWDMRSEFRKGLMLPAPAAVVRKVPAVVKKEKM